MRRLVLAAVAMLLVACGGDKVAGPNETVAGTYMLRSVNGANLPATYFQNSVEKDQFFDGSIVLAADHSWTGSLSVDATSIVNGDKFFHGPIPISGTYSLNANAINLTDGVNTLSFIGTVSGGTMTLNIDLGDIQMTAMVFSR